MSRPILWGWAPVLHENKIKVLGGEGRGMGAMALDKWVKENCDRKNGERLSPHHGIT